MKKLAFQFCASLLLVLSSLMPYLATAQPIPLANSNGTLVCPNRSLIFASNNSQNSNGCLVEWTVTGGTLLQSNPTTPGIMTVAFDDAPRGVATLQTNWTNCSTGAANGRSPLLTVYIRSITNEPLGALTLNGSTSGNIDFGSNAPVTLEVPLLTVPRNQDDPIKSIVYVNGYEWTIPAGWAWPDGTISNGVPRLFNSRSFNNPNQIRVTPPGNTCGNAGLAVRVRAVDTECAIGATVGYAPTRSAERSLNINCVLPTLRIGSNGAPAVVRCGDTRDYGFRGETVGAGPNSSTAYSWTTTNNWTPATSTAPIPGILPSGNTGTTITLRGTYSRGGISAPLAPS